MNTTNNGESSPTLSHHLQNLKAHGLGEKVSQPHHASLSKRASVSVLVSRDGHVLLNQRSNQLRSHPGQVCFPGGKQEENEDDWTTALRETREEVALELITNTPATSFLEEDIASQERMVSRKRTGETNNDTTNSSLKVQWLCRLRTMESLHHICVTPVVGYMAQQTAAEISTLIRCHADEVQAAFWMPLNYVLQATPTKEYEVPWSGETFVNRHYDYTTENAVFASDSEKNRVRAGPHTFAVTGLTAYIAYELAQIAHGDSIPYTLPENSSCSPPNPEVMSTTTSSTGSEDRNLSNPSSILPLYKWQDDPMTTRTPYWSRKHYTVSHDGNWLHQYDSERQAQRKVQAANKKHRLPLNDVRIFVEEEHPEKSLHNQKFVFELQALEGRVVWKLAAETHEERVLWVKHLSSLSDGD